MALLMTLDEAKHQLKVTDTLHDSEIQQFMSAADARIRQHLKDGNDPSWDSVTVPVDVKQAAQLWLTCLYYNRGDTVDAATALTDTWKTVEYLLIIHRDPAIA